MKTIIKKFGKFVLPLLALLIFIISRVMKEDNFFIEIYYSRSINKWLIQGLSQVTGIVSFSIGELLYIVHMIAIPIVLGLLTFKIIKGGILRFIKQIIVYISLIYVIFMLFWGLNYNRISIDEIIDLEYKNFNIQDLDNLNQALIIKANNLRTENQENLNGVMMIDGGYQSVFSRAYLGYKEIGEKYIIFDGNYGNPKPILLSRSMLYTGITGMYFPFTAEANVNTAIPHLLLPATTLHEMAHQRGIASEDEANYLAYLTATAHPDVDFQYSGIVLALIYTMHSLHSQDPLRASELKLLYSEGLKRDLENYYTFWIEYDGKVSDVSERVNDSYLKGNGQDDGINSYGLIVDLLLAHYYTYGEI